MGRGSPLLHSLLHPFLLHPRLLLLTLKLPKVPRRTLFALPGRLGSWERLLTPPDGLKVSGAGLLGGSLLKTLLMAVPKCSLKAPWGGLLGGSPLLVLHMAAP